MPCCIWPSPSSSTSEWGYPDRLLPALRNASGQPPPVFGETLSIFSLPGSTDRPRMPRGRCILRHRPLRLHSALAEMVDPRPDVLTPGARAFVAHSTGFPGENLFEPNAGAAGRTSAANPFEYVLRCCGLRALLSSACARRSRGPKENRLHREFTSACRS